MPFNPGITDRSGEFMAAGISSAFDSLAKGITGYRQEKRRKEEEDAAVAFLQKNGAKYGLNVTDDKELRAAVKAAGGGPQALGVFQAIEAAEQRKQAAATQQALAESHLADAALKRDASLRSAGAIRTAAGGEASLPELGAMLRSGGSFESTQPGAPRDEGALVMTALARGASAQDTAGLADTIGSLDKIRQGRKSFTPSMVDLGGGISAMMTSPNSAVPVTKGPGAAPKPSSPAGKLLADADALAAAGRPEDAELLRAIAKRPTEDKPMTLTDYLIAGGKPEDYRTYVESLRAKPAAPAAAPAPSAAKLGAKEQEAYKWAKANPADPRASAILKRLGL